MGKATRWFKGLLGIKRSDPPPATHPHPPPKEKRRWSFVTSYKDKQSSSSSTRLNARRAGDVPPPPPVSVRAPQAVPGYASGASNDPSKHAIVVAAASAAAAEAAVAAAHAAAAVVRLTTSGRRPNNPPADVIPDGVREFWAALVIQSQFRGYLARRALRALKGLVRLQALVRGHIMRKKTADTMRSIQAMLRAQARARIIRAYDSPTSSGKSSQLHHPGPPTPEKYEQSSYSTNMKRSQSPTLQRNQSRSVNRVIIHPDNSNPVSTWSDPHLDERTWKTQRIHPRHKPSTSFSGEDEFYLRSGKILEIDTGKPALQTTSKQRKNNISESKGSDFASDEYTTLSPFSCEVQSALNLNVLRVGTQDEDDDGAFCTAENSPHFYSTSSRGSRRSPLTPPRSDASGNSCFSGYSDCPSYMAYTESARAKMRSLSAPRQRPQQSYDRGGSGSRWSVHRQRAALASSSASTQGSGYASKGYPGSGRLDRLGMPVRNNTLVYYSGYLN